MASPRCGPDQAGRDVELTWSATGCITFYSASTRRRSVRALRWPRTGQSDDRGGLGLVPPGARVYLPRTTRPWPTRQRDAGRTTAQAERMTLVVDVGTNRSSSARAPACRRPDRPSQLGPSLGRPARGPAHRARPHRPETLEPRCRVIGVDAGRTRGVRDRRTGSRAARGSSGHRRDVPGGIVTRTASSTATWPRGPADRGRPDV
jgi:hypothetical protein